MNLIQDFLPQIIVTLLVFVIIPMSKYIMRKLIWKYAALSPKLEARTSHVVRVISIFINLSGVIAIVIVWGVDPRNIFVALSSIFAVIGVALFAQWSMLSNVTAGILIFFTTPFRIGDFIRIHDKDFPIEAYVVDILTFNTLLRTHDGEIIIYPNTLFFQKGVSVINSDDEIAE